MRLDNYREGVTMKLWLVRLIIAGSGVLGVTLTLGVVAALGAGGFTVIECTSSGRANSALGDKVSLTREGRRADLHITIDGLDGTSEHELLVLPGETWRVTGPDGEIASATVDVTDCDEDSTTTTPPVEPPTTTLPPPGPGPGPEPPVRPEPPDVTTTTIPEGFYKDSSGQVWPVEESG